MYIRCWRKLTNPSLHQRTIHCYSTSHSKERITQHWPGLHSYRSSSLDDRRYWHPHLPRPSSHPPPTQHTSPTFEDPKLPSLAHYAHKILSTPDIRQKCELTHMAFAEHLQGRLPMGSLPPRDGPPARPSQPELLPPRCIPTMKQSTLPLSAYTLHNLTHIELNAIDLAWDTILRFSSIQLPETFYTDFARVADDESRHLSWCLQRLDELGYFYGCMPAHNLLWEGCEASANDVCDRMAVVPMSQEARGLDAGWRLRDKLVGWGDNRTAAIIHRIAEEEKAHVAVGVYWFKALCAAEGIEDPGDVFRETLDRLCPDLLRAPFNHDAREEVGLLREWYDASLWSQRQEGDSNTGRKGCVVERERMSMDELKKRLELIVQQEADRCDA